MYGTSDSVSFHSEGISLNWHFIVCIGVSTAPNPPLSCQAPPLNLQTVQAPLFRQSPPLYRFFMNSLPKS